MAATARACPISAAWKAATALLPSSWLTGRLSTQRARRLWSRVAVGASAPWSSSTAQRPTHYEGVLVRCSRVQACPSLMSAGCCWWRSLAIDGGSGTPRGHGSIMRRPGSRWDGVVERPFAFRAGHIPSWHESWESYALSSMLGASLPLVVRHSYDCRTRADIAYLVAGRDRDRVRSAVLVIPVSCSNQRNLKGVAAPRAQRDTAGGLDLAIFVCYRKCGSAGRNGLCARRNGAGHHHQYGLAVRWPECTWSRRTATEFERLGSDLDGGPGSRLSWSR
jgi:hypothetical protein